MYLERYNSYIASLGKEYNLNIESPMYIPNNNMKLYCIVLSNVLYFFSSGGSGYDYYIKVHNVFQHDCLLEGYIYGDTYLLTDILMVRGNVVREPYTARYELLFNFDYSKLSNLNNKLTFGIHDIYVDHTVDDSRPFTEKVGYASKLNKRVVVDCDTTVEKIIRNTKFSDVYSVHCIDTNNQQGILYVKTIKESAKLRHIFKKDDFLRFRCKWNPVFGKYYIITNDTAAGLPP